jgi:hypothetical protein
VAVFSLADLDDSRAGAPPDPAGGAGVALPLAEGCAPDDGAALWDVCGAAAVAFEGARRFAGAGAAVALPAWDLSLLSAEALLLRRAPRCPNGSSVTASPRAEHPPQGLLHDTSRPARTRSTDLAGGQTSFGQDAGDAAALRAALGRFEVSRRAHKAMLQNLDAPSRISPEAGLVSDAPAAGHERAALVPSCSLRYRLALLRVLREHPPPPPPPPSGAGGAPPPPRAAALAPFSLLGRAVGFREWRAAELRLVVAAATVALEYHGEHSERRNGSKGEGREGCRGSGGAGDGEPGRSDAAPAWRGYDDAGGAEGCVACGGRWRVREEVRALSSAQLLRAVRVTARRVAAAEAPTPALWDAYCERAYARDTARLERLLSAIVRKYAWVDELGPVGLQLYEQLVTVLCSDPLAGGGEALGASFGGGAALPDALAALLRAPRESLDLSERVHAACHAAVAWRNFRASRDALRLAEVLAELRRLLAFPPRDFRGKAAPRPPPPPPVLTGHVSSFPPY